MLPRNLTRALGFVLALASLSVSGSAWAITFPLDPDVSANKLGATSCLDGTVTDVNGVVSCKTAASAPEYVARAQIAGGTVQAYGVVTNNGSTADSVIEAATTVTSITGCSASATSVSSTNALSIQNAGVAQCSTDSTVVAGSLVKLGATGQFALGTSAEKTWGRAITSNSSGSAFILLFASGADGFIDHKVDIWPSVPDITATGTTTMVSVAPSVDMSGVSLPAKLIGYSFTPISSSSATILGLEAFDSSPALTITGGTAATTTFGVGGTFTISGGTLNPEVLIHSTTYTSATASQAPIGTGIGWEDKPTISSTAASGSATSTTYETGLHNPSVSNGAGNFTLTNDVMFAMTGTYTKGAGTLDVTNRKFLVYSDPTDASSVLDNNVAIDCGALAKGTTLIACMQSAITAGAGKYAVRDTGGAQWAAAGKFTTYNNIATAGLGLPTIYGESGVSATKTANFTALSYTPPATAGRYRASALITTTSSTNTGTLQCTVDYVDSQGTTHTGDIMPIHGAAGTVAASQTSVASKEFHCGTPEFSINNAATAIVVKVVITGTVSYTVAATVEQIA